MKHRNCHRQNVYDSRAKHREYCGGAYLAPYDPGYEANTSTLDEGYLGYPILPIPSVGMVATTADNVIAL